MNRGTGLTSALTNLRTGEHCNDENALLAATLADTINLGLGRMAAASRGATRDTLSGRRAPLFARTPTRRRWPGS